MAGRAELVDQIAALVGHNVLQVTDRQLGWPALGTLRVEDASILVALFVGPIGLSQRGRDQVERRFQNPAARATQTAGNGVPIVVPEGRYPVLLGLWYADPLVPVPLPVLVSADATRRVGFTTRYSVFVSVAALTEGALTGWAENTSDSAEVMRYLLPPLLPASVLADRGGFELPGPLVQAAVEGSGLTEFEGIDLNAADRARRATLSIARDSRFSKRVITAYGGLCAMCGLDISLVQGAHIYPASAPGSPDEPWNGMALCPNHHLVFDRHLLGVLPDDGRIRFHDRVLEQIDRPAVASMVNGTFPGIVEPDDPALRPKPEMFRSRYAHFEGQYDWLETA